MVVHTATPPAISTTAEPMTTNASVTQLYHFDKGTWVENIAVRSNGNLVVVLYDRPEVWELNPLTPNKEAKLVYRFEDGTRTTGITETVDQNFVVMVAMKAGGYTVWKLGLSGPQVKPTRVLAAVPGAGQLNDLTKFSQTVLLAADTSKGVVHRFNLDKGESSIILKDPTMGVPIIGGGINGVRYRGGFLYYTNSVKGHLARIPIDSISAEATGPAEIIAKNLLGIDDFALGRSEDEFFVMDWIRSKILRITAGGKVDVVADGTDGIAWPTSAQFGRTGVDRDTIYVTGSGNPVSQAFGKFEGGKVLAVKV